MRCYGLVREAASATGPFSSQPRMNLGTTGLRNRNLNVRPRLCCRASCTALALFRPYPLSIALFIRQIKQEREGKTICLMLSTSQLSWLCKSKLFLHTLTLTLLWKISQRKRYNLVSSFSDIYALLALSANHPPAISPARCRYSFSFATFLPMTPYTT